MWKSCFSNLIIKCGIFNSKSLQINLTVYVNVLCVIILVLECVIIYFKEIIHCDKINFSVEYMITCMDLGIS